VLVELKKKKKKKKWGPKKRAVVTGGGEEEDRRKMDQKGKTIEVRQKKGRMELPLRHQRGGGKRRGAETNAGARLKTKKGKNVITGSRGLD